MLSVNRRNQIILICCIGVTLIFALSKTEYIRSSFIRLRYDHSIQNGIIPESDRYAYFAMFNVDYSILETEAGLSKFIKAIHNFTYVLDNVSQVHKCHVTGTLSFGKKLWTLLINNKESLQNTGSELFDFPAYGDSPSTQCDLYIHIHSMKYDANIDAAREIIALFQKKRSILSVFDEQFGFTYKEGRDLTGFIDGTMNPKGYAHRYEVAIGSDGSSYVFVQRFVHKLKKWEKLTVSDQEQVIGRTKKDSIELADLPSHAHISKADVTDNGQSLEILRHSMPYGSPTGDMGLWFTAYCHSIHNHDMILKSLNGVGENKEVDSLLTYIKPVTGSYFYVPSQDMLDML